VKAAAELLNSLDPENQKRLLADLQAKDPEMARAIEQEMYTFEDILRIDDRGTQLLIREFSGTRLALALRNASDQTKERIFTNLSKKASELLKDELGNLGPQKLSDVQAAQNEIVRRMRELEGAGQLSRKPKS
jgi:flagellar motor switch protein FliG